MSPNSLKFSNLLYKFLFNMVSNKKSPWLEYIKGILINCGFSGIWDAQKVENPRWLVRSIKQKNKDLDINHWFSNVDASSSCINYRLFKENFALENYMLKLPYACRKILCLFRTRNHHLPIETGRWSNTDISERKCNLCNISPGDEFHYLMNCKFLASERKRYIKAYYFRQPNVIKFKQLMNVRNLKQLKNLSKSKKENPEKLTQLSSRSHPRHLVGKRTAQKDTIIDITSDSQVNSNFPYRWTPSSLTFNNYFYLFLYLYIM